MGSYLAKFCHSDYPEVMTTMNISLPETLKAFVDTQVSNGGYGTSSEYVRELIRKDQDRSRLRELLLDGARSEPVGEFDKTYFDRLRSVIKTAPAR